MDLTGGVAADAENEIEREQRGEAAHGCRQHAKHTELGAIVAVLGVERIADEAAIAGSGAEQPDLPLKLHGGRRHQRDAEPGAGVADGQTSGEIVAAVNDQVVTAKQPVGIVRIDPLLDRMRDDEWLSRRTNCAASSALG